MFITLEEIAEKCKGFYCRASNLDNKVGQHYIINGLVAPLNIGSIRPFLYLTFDHQVITNQGYSHPIWNQRTDFGWENYLILPQIYNTLCIPIPKELEGFSYFDSINQEDINRIISVLMPEIELTPSRNRFNNITD